MTLNELIENSEKAWTNEYDLTDDWIEDALNMLRQQAKEIEQLNFVLKNLTLATNKKINELEEEIENLKSKVSYWKGLHR
jgi:polyhydroxyalkanoate synthesis regulator phasin